MSGPAIPHAEYDRRLAAVRGGVERVGCDALIAFASTMRPGDGVYLGGYAPTNGFALVAATGTDFAVLADQAWDTGLSEGAWLAGRLQASDDLARDAADIVGRPKRIAVSGLGMLPWPVARELERLTGAELVDAPEAIGAARRIKSDVEIAMLREAARITSLGARAFLDGVRAGSSERELALEVYAAMARAGSGRLAFPLILGAGAERTAGAVPLPGERRLVAGDLVLLDCGGTWGGYCGDISRVALVGRPSDEQLHLLEATHACYTACVEAVAPGVSTGDLHALALRTAREHGYDLPFLLGHATGCANWEPPAVDGTSREELLPGMVIAIEPGIYVPAVGGARLEDMLLVTATGHEVLTDAPLVTWR